MSKSIQKPGAQRSKDPRPAPNSSKGIPAEAQECNAREQMEAFEKAVAAFQSGRFQTAKELFEQAAAGPFLEMAHSSRLHAKMCEHRLKQPVLALNSPDDHYNYAIALINGRRVEAAEAHLREALLQVPQGDHLYYALALCRGLAGDLKGACENLNRAVELQPRNRVLARSDPDFAEIARESPLLEILYPEKANPA